MISMSLTDGLEWDVVKDLYVFCSERAYERIATAGARHDSASLDEQWRDLQVLDVVYAHAKHHPRVSAQAGQYLRRKAICDQGHEAFRAGWARVPAHAASWPARSSGGGRGGIRLDGLR